MARLPEPTTALGARPSANLQRTVVSHPTSDGGAGALAQGLGSLAAAVEKKADAYARTEALKQYSAMQEEALREYTERKNNIAEQPHGFSADYLSFYDDLTERYAGQVDPRAREWFQEKALAARAPWMRDSFVAEDTAFRQHERDGMDEAVRRFVNSGLGDEQSFNTAWESVYNTVSEANMSGADRRELMASYNSQMFAARAQAMADGGQYDEALDLFLNSNDPRIREMNPKIYDDTLKYLRTKGGETQTQAALDRIADDPAEAVSWLSESDAVGLEHVTYAKRKALLNDARRASENEFFRLQSTGGVPALTGTATDSAKDIAANIRAYAREENMPAAFALATAQMESAMGQHSSTYDANRTYNGVFQLGPNERKKWGAGLRGGMAALAARYRSAKRTAGDKFQPWMGYIAHQQGEAGFRRLWRNPNKNAAELLGAEKVRANLTPAQLKEIDKAGGLSKLTAKQFLEAQRERLERASVVVSGHRLTSETPETSDPSIAAPTIKASSVHTAPLDNFHAFDQAMQTLDPNWPNVTLARRQTFYENQKKLNGARVDAQRLQARLDNAQSTGARASQKDVNDAFSAAVDATPDASLEEGLALGRVMTSQYGRAPEQYRDHLRGMASDPGDGNNFAMLREEMRQLEKAGVSEDEREDILGDDGYANLKALTRMVDQGTELPKALEQLQQLSSLDEDLVTRRVKDWREERMGNRVSEAYKSTRSTVAQFMSAAIENHPDVGWFGRNFGVGDGVNVDTAAGQWVDDHSYALEQAYASAPAQYRDDPEMLKGYMDGVVKRMLKSARVGFQRSPNGDLVPVDNAAFPTFVEQNEDMLRGSDVDPKQAFQESMFEELAPTLAPELYGKIAAWDLEQRDRSVDVHAASAMKQESEDAREEINRVIEEEIILEATTQPGTDRIAHAVYRLNPETGGYDPVMRVLDGEMRRLVVDPNPAEHSASFRQEQAARGADAMGQADVDASTLWSAENAPYSTSARVLDWMKRRDVARPEQREIRFLVGENDNGYSTAVDANGELLLHNGQPLIATPDGEITKAEPVIVPVHVEDDFDRSKNSTLWTVSPSLRVYADGRVEKLSPEVIQQWYRLHGTVDPQGRVVRTFNSEAEARAYMAEQKKMKGEFFTPRGVQKIMKQYLEHWQRHDFLRDQVKATSNAG